MGGWQMKRDFFVSYTEPDEQWAKWIAAVLEANGYTCYIQAWDFRPGSNFVVDMQNALTNSERFIAVLSDDYIKSLYCQSEWAAAFTEDPNGEKRRLIPVRVEDIEPEGLLAAIVYIDLVGLDEAEAEKRLLNGVDTKDIPRNRPPFPGSPKVRFPGSLPARVVTISKPLPPTADFMGREDIISKIETALAGDRKVVLVNGIGGIGKTLIFRKLFFACAEKGFLGVERVGWLTFRGDLASTFAGQFVDVEFKDSDNAAYLRKAEQYLNEAGRGLLLFVDNADAITDEDTLRLRRLNCRVVLTSRRQELPEIQTIKVNELPLADCRKLYRRHSKDKTAADTVLNAIIGLAKRHTLAVELLAKTQWASGETAESLLEKLKDKGFSLPEIGENVTHLRTADDRSVHLRFIEHMTILFDIADVQGEPRRVLGCFSLLAPDTLSVKTAKEWCGLPTADVINELHRRGWLLKEGDGVGIHPVISEVVRLQHPITDEEARQLAEHVGIALNMSATDVFTEKLPFLPHALSLAQGLSHQENEDTARLLHNIASVYDDQGNYPKALEWYNKALEIYEKVMGKEHPSTATTYNNIGLVYDKKGDYPKALEWYHKALAIYEKVLGKEHPYTAATYNNIGLVCKNQGDYPKALEWYDKVLPICEQVLGKEHPSTATTYNNIASVYDDQGNYPKALEWYEKVLPICEKVLGKEHPHTAATYNNIGGVYQSQGEYDKALEWFRKDLEISEKVLGKEHPSTATTYNNIALVYDNQGDYAEAMEWYRKALAIFEKKLGEEHPSTAATRNSIAVLRKLLPTPLIELP
jgi:tetratricopeptide (TPR) repeat protein